MIRIVAVFVLSLSVIFASWAYYFHVEDLQLRSSGKVRQATVQRQHAEQRLRRLGDGHTSPLLNVLGEDISALQIRLAEYLAGVGTASESADKQFMYEQSLLARSLSTDGLVDSPDTHIQAIRILRLDVKAQLAHTQKFIGLLRGIQSQIGGWPVSVHTCDLQRLPVQLLNARCVIDIYHWSVHRDEAGS